MKTKYKVIATNWEGPEDEYIFDSKPWLNFGVLVAEDTRTGQYFIPINNYKLVKVEEYTVDQ